MVNLEKTDIRLGYVPLLDCIALLWAKHQGYFSDQGLNVTLVKEASWASLRDRLAFGFLDVAHCLSAMLPAANIGTDQIGVPFQTPLVLSVNRAYISLSQKLCYELHIQPTESPLTSAEKIVARLQQQNLNLAHVFHHSIHHYCLKEWLALADEHTAQQTKLFTCPPPYMVEAISKQNIDGFCVGEPWNIQAKIQGYSHIIAESKQIIPEVADKVLAVTQNWATQHPNTLKAITQAITQAQHDLQNLQSSAEVWEILIEYNIIRFDCSEHLHVQEFHKILNIISKLIPDHNTPNMDDFAWIIQQMQKWDALTITPEMIKTIAQHCIIDIA